MSPEWDDHTMYLTPYRWTTAEGLTHVVYENNAPPGPIGFGWSSICDEVQLPIEGEDFKLNEDVTEEDITCRRCRERFDQLELDLDDDSIANLNGCLIRYDRTKEGVITYANRVCRGPLHYHLPFEPDSFSGDLEKQVEEVCSECWETYVDNQWRSDGEGAELQVNVYGEDSHAGYHAAHAETRHSGSGGAFLRLVSENGLEKVLHREEIESITLTPAKVIDY